MVDDVLRRGSRFYRLPNGEAFMPIEFGAAAYRFGHSMVRPCYRANFTNRTGDSTNPAADPFFALVFDATEPNSSDRSVTTAMTCWAALPRAAATSAGSVLRRRRRPGQEQQEDRYHRRACCSGSRCPRSRPYPQTAPTVLPQRNLLRQLTWGLRYSRAVARAMGVVDPVARADLEEIVGDSE